MGSFVVWKYSRPTGEFFLELLLNPSSVCALSEKHSNRCIMLVLYSVFWPFLIKSKWNRRNTHTVSPLPWYKVKGKICLFFWFVEKTSNNLLPSSLGISTKKNVAINASKDYSGSHLWGNSSIPFGGTLPSRGTHGKSLRTSYTRAALLCLRLLTAVYFNYQAQIQSQVDTCRRFTKKTLVLPVTEGIRVLQWSQQHQVRMSFELLVMVFQHICCFW